MVGNISNYTKIDILRCFLAISEGVSRIELVSALELGEGTIRTLLNILKNKNLIQSTRQGHSLTKKGIQIKKEMLHSISIPKKIKFSLYPRYKKIAIRIHSISTERITIEKRDEAVKNGADGCLIFSYLKGLHLLIFKLDLNFTELENQLEMSDKDVLVVTFAKSNKWAEISCLAVALSIDNKLKKLFSSFY